MNLHVNDEPDRVFPLDAPVARVESFRAVRLAGAIKPAPIPIVMGNRAFIRSWVGRRMKAVPTVASRNRPS